MSGTCTQAARHCPAFSFSSPNGCHLGVLSYPALPTMDCRAGCCMSRPTRWSFACWRQSALTSSSSCRLLRSGPLASARRQPRHSRQQRRLGGRLGSGRRRWLPRWAGALAGLSGGVENSVKQMVRLLRYRLGKASHAQESLVAGQARVAATLHLNMLPLALSFDLLDLQGGGAAGSAGRGCRGAGGLQS